MHYHHCTAEDFVADASFRKWILDPDPDTQAYWNQWLKVAASVAVAAMLFYLLRYPWHYATYGTAYGETKTMVLPDQTQVVMKAHSALKFDKHWQANQKREVWLKGCLQAAFL